MKSFTFSIALSNKSCFSREGNANTRGRIRAGGVARFVVLLSLESLADCLSLSLSLSLSYSLRFRGNDDDEKNVKEMMR